MAYYNIDTPALVRGAHLTLVGPPLLIIMTFCFLLVLLQPHPSPSFGSNAPQQSDSRQSTVQSPLSPVSSTPAPALAPIGEVSGEVSLGENPAIAAQPLSGPVQSSASSAAAVGGGSLPAAAISNQPSKTAVESILNKPLTVSVSGKSDISIPGNLLKLAIPIRH